MKREGYDEEDGKWLSNDVSLDFECNTVPFYGGRAHEGFVRAANWFDRRHGEETNVTDRLLFLHTAFPSYPVVLVGHSMGKNNNDVHCVAKDDVWLCL